MRKILFVLLLSLFPALFASAEQSADMKSFGQCLADKGARMYSGWWCPHCYAQLREFDPALKRKDMKEHAKAKQEFPFLVECAEGLAPGELSLAACQRKFRGVPTWFFPGEQEGEAGTSELKILAEKTGCPLPRSPE